MLLNLTFLPDVVRNVKWNKHRLFIIIRGSGDDHQDNVAKQMLQVFQQQELEAVLVDPDEKQRTHKLKGMLYEIECRYIREYEHIIINNENRRLRDYNRLHKLGLYSGFDCLTLDLFDHFDNVEPTPQHHVQLDRNYFNAP